MTTTLRHLINTQREVLDFRTTGAKYRLNGEVHDYTLDNEQAVVIGNGLANTIRATSGVVLDASRLLGGSDTMLFNGRRGDHNDTLSAYELTRPLTLRREAEAGSTVRLVWGAVEKRVTVSENGNWLATVSAEELPADDGVTTLRATASDAAGNVSATTSRTRTVDTIAPPQPTLDAVSGDNRITAAEQIAGLTLAGRAEPDAYVSLEWGRKWYTGRGRRHRPVVANAHQ